MIYGTGTDYSVTSAASAPALERHGERFAHKVPHEAELVFARPRGAVARAWRAPLINATKAKEAFSTLVGLIQPMVWRDCEGAAASVHHRGAWRIA